jgi:hypothetical protein
VSKKNVYHVRTTGGGNPRLIRATNKQQAMGFAARSTLAADLASQDTLIDLVGKGIKVEDAVETSDAE